MKCFLATLIFVCFGLIGYTQSTFPLPKNIQGQKNNLSTGSAARNYLTNPAAGCNSKQSTQVGAGSKIESSIISIFPALRLWLLPGNFPNPFSRDDD